MFHTVSWRFTWLLWKGIQWIREKSESKAFSIVKAFVIEMPSTYLQCQVEPLLAVPFVVQTFLKPQGAALLLLVTDHIELLLLVSRHNTKGQLGVFTNVPVLCCKIQDLRTSYNQQLHCVKGTGYLHFDNKKIKSKVLNLRTVKITQVFWM